MDFPSDILGLFHWNTEVHVLVYWPLFVSTLLFAIPDLFTCVCMFRFQRNTLIKTQKPCHSVILLMSQWKVSFYSLLSCSYVLYGNINKKTFIIYICGICQMSVLWKFIIVWLWNSTTKIADESLIDTLGHGEELVHFIFISILFFHFQQNTIHNKEYNVQCIQNIVTFVINKS